MAVGAQAVQRTEVAAFSVVVAKIDGVYEYEIRDRSADVSMPEIADALFSIALDVHDKERASR